MIATVLQMDYPCGTLPIAGFRCPQCGEEAFTAEQVQRTQDAARRLGLYGVEQEEERTLIKTGGSIVVTLDPRLVREVLHGKPGSRVVVGRQGNAIVIRPARRPRIP